MPFGKPGAMTGRQRRCGSTPQIDLCVRRRSSGLAIVYLMIAKPVTDVAFMLGAAMKVGGRRT